jgi:zinc protease
VSKLPQAGELLPFVPPGFERIRLANQLDVLIARKAGMPVVDMQLVVRGGGATDSPALAGRASLTAELLDEGSRRHSALEISDRVELLGADFDVRVNWDAWLLTMHGLVPHLQPMLDLLMEVALEPAFPTVEFKRKHEERLHRLRQERTEPRIVASKAVARAVFGDQHIYGRPLSGTPETIGQLDCTGVVSCYRAGFGPAVSHLVMAGRIDPDQVRKELEARFGAWSNPVSLRSHVTPVRMPGRTLYLIDRPDAAQSEIRAGHVGLPRNTPDYLALTVLNTVLGGSFKSRLNTILREEKGFTYGASSSFSFRRESGMFSAGTAVFTDNTAETVAIVVSELERLRDQGVSHEELERARRYHALGFARTFETASDVSDHLAALALYDLEDTFLQTFTERIGAVTAAEVDRAARIYLKPDELSIVVVGDRARVLDSLRALQLGPIVEWEAQ